MRNRHEIMETSAAGLVGDYFQVYTDGPGYYGDEGTTDSWSRFEAEIEKLTLKIRDRLPGWTTDEIESALGDAMRSGLSQYGY